MPWKPLGIITQQGVYWWSRVKLYGKPYNWSIPVSRSRSGRMLWFFFFLSPYPIVSGELRFGRPLATDARPDLICGDALIPSSGITSACSPLPVYAKPFPLQRTQLPSTTGLWTYPHVFSLLLTKEGVPSSSSTLSTAMGEGPGSTTN